MCAIIAPMKLLEYQADFENYRLQFKGEIEPGSEEFWNLQIGGRQIEVEETKKLYNIDEANIILENLYDAGKLSPIDLGVYTEYENEFSWSRRVHALERIADKVPVWTNYFAYAEFSAKPYLRYLYNTYQSARGPTLFRPKDRLYLTKSILDRYFDFDLLSVENVVRTCTALHDGNTGETVTINMLMLRWVYFWTPAADVVGSPFVSDAAYASGVKVSFYMRPFSQPFADIRDYYGEKIALYFAWLGFYTFYLIYAAILGLALEFVFIGRGYEQLSGSIDWVVLGYVACSVVWNVVYSEGWKKECETCALRWGTRGLEQTEKPRPQFRGDIEKPLLRSSITDITETHFPKSKRNFRIFTSYLVLFALISINVGIIASIYILEALVYTDYTEFYFNGFTLVVNVVQALQIQASSVVFDWISRQLNVHENYRTETDYEDALITKTIVFQLVNNFGVPMFTAVGKGPLLQSCETSCLYDLSQLLYVIIVIRTLGNLFRTCLPYIRYLFGISESDERGAWNPVTKHEEIEDDDLISRKYEDEFKLEAYKGTFDLYAQSVIQYGYINFFSNAVPLLNIVSCVENLLRIRLEAFALCKLTRRPHVLLAEDEGMWGNLMDMISVLGVISSCAIICFTFDDFDNYSYKDRTLIFIGLFQILLAFKFVLHLVLAPNMEEINKLASRNEFIVDKYHSIVERTGSSVAGSTKGHISVALDNPALYDLRKSKPWDESDFKDLEELELRRKDLNRDIKVLKDKLHAVYKFETYNENTGIGETKHGLPLGRLSVRIVELQDFNHKDIPKFCPGFALKIRTLIKGSRQTGKQAGPAWTPKADSEVHKLDSTCKIVFNQVMGPFAPIRTQDAEVIFEIMEVPKGGKGKLGVSVATTSKRLRELLDQRIHNEVLNVQIRNDNGMLMPSNSRLFVSLEFVYSQIVPIRNELYILQEQVRNIEDGVQRIKDRKNVKSAFSV